MSLKERQLYLLIVEILLELFYLTAGLKTISYKLLIYLPCLLSFKNRTCLLNVCNHQSRSKYT